MLNCNVNKKRLKMQLTSKADLMLYVLQLDNILPHTKLVFIFLKIGISSLIR